MFSPSKKRAQRVRRHHGGQLSSRQEVLLKAVNSAPKYKFYALSGGPPFRPGMVRMAQGDVGRDLRVTVAIVNLELKGVTCGEYQGLENLRSQTYIRTMDGHSSEVMRKEKEPCSIELYFRGTCWRS